MQKNKKVQSMPYYNNVFVFLYFMCVKMQCSLMADSFCAKK